MLFPKLSQLRQLVSRSIFSIRPASRCATKNKAHDYSELERRQLLVAGITFDAGTVFIEGSNANDRSLVTMLDEDTINVTLSGGVDSQTFDVVVVDLIRFRGLNGDDQFTNMTDINATAYGHGGNDRLIGGGGHNRLQGGPGEDLLVGGDRNDALRGGEGNDTILGGVRHDRLFGGGGDDEIRGQHGRDRIDGNDGDDDLSGGRDNDRINGGNGNDFIAGNTGNDRLNGGDDNDTLKGGEGDDMLSGERGDDLLQGLEGNDRLYGDIGSDDLEGGIGNDVLFGGIRFGDKLDGGTGFDRFLISEEDSVSNRNDDDAVIQFVNSGNLLDGGLWVDSHVKVVDQAFELIQEKSSDRLDFLQDSLTGGRLIFTKGNDVEPRNVAGSEGRMIEIGDWDLDSDVANQATVLSVIHQVAGTWDSLLEINAKFVGAQSIYTDFLAESEWEAGTEVPPGFAASTDGEWFYREGSEFVDARGMTNPTTDWATVWELSLDPMADPEEISRLAAKIAHVDQLFALAGA